MHHEQFQLGYVMNHKFLKAIGQIVPCLLVRPITDVGHQSDSLELAPNTRINTLRPTPAWLQQKQDETCEPTESQNTENRSK